MGFLGYDVVREVESLPNVPHDDRHMPDGVMSVIGSLAAFDHWRQRVYLIESVPVVGKNSQTFTTDELNRLYDEASARALTAVDELARPLPYTPVEPPQRDDVLPVATSSMPNGAYQRAVEVAKEYIRAGDIFQVVLSQRYELQLEADPFDMYRVLRQVNPSPYMYFLRHPGVTIVGSSPEPMVQLLGGRVISRPIAGTRKRGTNDEHDRRLAAELRENPKEVAEHVMLVDLRSKGVTGKEAELVLGNAHMTINKNSIPNDPEKPMVTSGVRIGTPAMTTRGFKDEEARLTANLIADVLDNPRDQANIDAVRAKVHALTSRFPVYK